MKSSLKKKWVAALRSGDYKQGKTYLRDVAEDDEPDRLCCLGVLCNIIDPDGWHLSTFEGAYAHDKNGCNALSRGFKSRIDLSNDQETTLIRMNDEDTASFSAIATWIEENVK